MSRILNPEDVTEDMTIQAVRTFTYSLKQIYNDMLELDAEDITMDDLVNMVCEFAKEDLSCGYGHCVEEDDIEFIYNLGDGISYE